MPKDETILKGTIPSKNDWTLDDLDKKRFRYKMSRSAFVFEAVDMLYNLDNDVLDVVYNYAKKLHVPAWMVLQNFIIDRLAYDEAINEVWGAQSRIRHEFTSVDTGDGPRLITGRELQGRLRDLYKSHEKPYKFFCEREREEASRDNVYTLPEDAPRGDKNV